MKIYITRHGQVADHALYDGDPLFPKGEVPLSALGREQSRLLGEYLKEIGFCGKIYASPYLRTLETAEVIAEIIHTDIVPVPKLREIFKYEEVAREFEGSPMEVLIEKFPHIAANSKLPYPWWEYKAESFEDVYARVAQAMDGILQIEKSDCLIVAHGASTAGAMNYFKLERDLKFLWNCSLTLYDTENNENNFVNNTIFLSEDMVTNNKKPKKEYEML